MNNTQKLTIVTTAAALVVGYTQISKTVTLNHLAERFPQVDRKIAKEAYRKVMRMALTGKLDLHNYSEEQFDMLFLQEVAKLNAK